MAKRCDLAMRIEPFAGSLSADDRRTQSIVAAARLILCEAKAHGVLASELQIDFDGAQKRLAGYRLCGFTPCTAFAFSCL
jgi:hypothetical protein